VGAFLIWVGLLFGMMALLRLLPATLKLGARSATALFVLEHGQVHFCPGLQGSFWVRKLLEKTVPP